MSALESTITDAFERRSEISPSRVDAAVRDAIEHVIADLDAGRLRVAEQINGAWVTHQWVKKAVLLYFRSEEHTSELQSH